MPVSKGEKRQRTASTIALPVLIVGAFAAVAWRNVEDYAQSAELRVANGEGQEYADARWSLNRSRLIGDGRDTKIVLPGALRLVIVRLSAAATGDIGDRWSRCSLTLTDDQGRRWKPLSFILSSDLSREIEPGVTPVEGCDSIARTPPAKGASTVMEEKFVVPADAAPTLKAQLSFAASRPDALSFPLNLK